jgi:hypothetical protein
MDEQKQRVDQVNQQILLLAEERNNDIEETA